MPIYYTHLSTCSSGSFLETLVFVHICYAQDVKRAESDSFCETDEQLVVHIGESNRIDKKLFISSSRGRTRTTIYYSQHQNDMIN